MKHDYIKSKRITQNFLVIAEVVYKFYLKEER